MDDRLAPPETRVEYLNGQEIFAAPAGECHGRQHSYVDRVIGANVREPYAVAVDMLTRTEEGSDFAADVSVYEPTGDPRAEVPIARKLEEIVFEVVDRQAAAIPTRKAVELKARGVRRVFAVFTKERAIFEWSSSEGRWEKLATDAVIEDPCFVRPISANGIVDWLQADNEVAEALLTKRPEPIVKALAAEREEGREEGQLLAKQQVILGLLGARGVPVSEQARARIQATKDMALLDRWVTAVLTVTDAEQLFG
ncbi:MAG: Uma2 family endonuclease [Polyangiaceae bacterium]